MSVCFFKRCSKMNIRDLVSTRERDTSGVRTSSTSNLNLKAANIRLRVARTRVQRNRLSTNKVVARSDILGHSERALAAVSIEDLGTPGCGGAGVAVFCNLEKGASGCGGRIGDLGHVDKDWAIVGAADGGIGAGAVTRLGVHFYGEGRTGCCC